MITRRRSRDAMTTSEAGEQSSSPSQADHEARTPSSPLLAASGFGRIREPKTPERQVMYSDKAQRRTRSPPPAPKAPTRSYRLAQRQGLDVFTFARRLDFEDDPFATPRSMRCTKLTSAKSAQKVDDDVFNSLSRSPLPNLTRASSKAGSTSKVAKLAPAIELTSERPSSPSPASASSFRSERWLDGEHVKRPSTDEVQRAHGPIKRSRGPANIEEPQHLHNSNPLVVQNGYRERLRSRPAMSSPLCVDMERCKTVTMGIAGPNAWKPPFGVQRSFTATAMPCTSSMARSASHASYLVRSPSSAPLGAVRTIIVPTPPLSMAQTRSRVSARHGRSASLASSLHLSRACSPSSRSSSPALHSSSTGDYFGNWATPSNIARAH